MPDCLLYVPNGNKLYINFGSCAYHLVLDCSTYEVKKVIRRPSASNSDAYGVWNWKRNKIYFGFSLSPESIAVVDAEKDTIIKWIRVRNIRPWGRCYNSKNDKVYAMAGSGMVIIDCKTDSIIKIINHPQYWFSRCVVWDSIGNKVYCGSVYSTVIGVVDCERDSLIKIIDSRVWEPYQIVYNFLERKIYVIEERGEFTSTICTIGDTLIKRFNWPLFDYDIRIIYNKRKNKIYFPGYDTIAQKGVIYIIDCKTDSIIKTIMVGELGDMYLTEWSNRLYFICYDYSNNCNILYVLDCETDSILSQLRFGSGACYPYGIEGNPKTRHIYISDYWGNALYVIRDEIVSLKEDKCKKDKIDIFPKIRKSFLDISSIENFKKIEIYDILGKLILKDKVSLNKLKKGVYIVKIDNEKKKIIVIR